MHIFLDLYEISVRFLIAFEIILISYKNLICKISNYTHIDYQIFLAINIKKFLNKFHIEF